MNSLKLIGLSVIGLAAFVTAATILWKKVLYPAAQGVTLLGQMLPILKDFTEAFKDNPNVFKVLNQIAAQFRTDSGSSLRDVVDRLETGQGEQAVLAGEISIEREVERRLAVQDREQLARLLRELARLGVRVDQGAEASLRNEETAKQVKIDLTDTQHRADHVDSSEPEAAADAAAQTGTAE